MQTTQQIHARPSTIVYVLGAIAAGDFILFVASSFLNGAFHPQFVRGLFFTSGLLIAPLTMVVFWADSVLNRETRQ